ncbi:MAG: SPASM domain-containing protein [Spirochaetaceae bacterium]|nr:SPASM domain-containing protein [Spirochaetaceae bacterium]
MLTEYIISKYNIVFDYRNKSYIYNSLLGSFAEIQDDVKYLLEANNVSALCQNSVFSDLLDGGFIIEKENDESITLLNRLTEDRDSVDTLYLTIILTMNCNLRCIYCYQNNAETHRVSSRSVSSDFYKDLISFIQRYKHLKRLEITWFGGEPLLEIAKIDCFSKALIDFCFNHDIEYGASIITNGLLLNDANIKILIDNKVTSMQLTLDGPKDVHDLRRVALSKNLSCYDKIISFLKSKYAVEFDIALRINIDKGNISNIESFIKDLKPFYKNNMNIDFAEVENYNEFCNNANEVFSTEEFSDIEIQLEKSLISLGMRKDPMSIYPKPTHSYCGATRKSSFMVMHNGDLFKCWCDLEDVKMKNGNIKGNKITENFYTLDNPLVEGDCRECKILPLCMGGCQYKKHTSKMYCPTIKYNIIERLKLTLELFENAAQ